jgi:hypothetical protein
VRIEEGLKRKDVRVISIIYDRNFSFAQWVAAAGSPIGLNGLEYIVLSDLGEAASKGRRPNEIPTWIGFFEANGRIAGVGMNCNSGEQQPISMNGFDQAPQDRGHGVAEASGETTERFRG